MSGLLGITLKAYLQRTKEIWVAIGINEFEIIQYPLI